MPLPLGGARIKPTVAKHHIVGRATNNVLYKAQQRQVMIQSINCANIVTFLVGIGLFTCGLYMFIESYELARHSESSVGTVVKLESERGKSMWYYSAIIDFQTRKGKHIEFKSKPLIVSNFGNWPIFQEGQIFPIRYHAQNPRSAIIDSFLHLWFPSAGLVFLGIAALVVAITMPLNSKGF